jgi:hypothetical protein
VRGVVTTIINDSVFQASSPFRHAAAQVKILQKADSPKILMKFTDGGTDQRNNLESVKCAQICLFKELDLDLLVLARCAPGQSWTNPAERVMSVLNLGLQNVSLERQPVSKEVEAKLKSCNSMSGIRQVAEGKDDIKAGWAESIEPVQSVVRNRFSRLKLKDAPFQVMDPVSDLEIDVLKRHLCELFPDLNIDRLQKAHTQKIKSYNEWLTAHCRSRHYSFQIRKCGDRNCCLEPHSPPEDLQWLPDPVLDPDDRLHYKRYDTVKGTETTEEDRPSLKIPAKTKKGQRPPTVPVVSAPDAPEVPERDTAHVPEGTSTIEAPDSQIIVAPFMSSDKCSVQTARLIVSCVECEKPRVIYCKNSLSERQKISLATSMSQFDYTCGAALLPPSHSLCQKVMTRGSLVCALPLEIPYYGSGLGQTDMCCHCGVLEGIVDQDLRRKYKTVLPICETCRHEGKNVIVQRQYGNIK